MSGRNAGDLDTPAYFDSTLDAERRIDALLEVMTLAEKINCLGTNPSVPRLGIKGCDHVEGLHGLALGGPGRWGRDNPIPTTTFPQAIGLGCTWDPGCVREVAEVESYEARYLFQSPQFERGGLVVRAPNADLARDPRWGRTEECYGEDPYLTSCLVTAFVEGLQGTHPKYWRTASLLKHFLANSNEDGRESSSSDFSDRLFHEYYAVPFRHAIEGAGARAFMAAYNKYNGIPCAVHPVLKELTVKQWGNDGIICTDGGAYRMLVTEHHHYSTYEEAAAATIRAGISQYLDHYQDGITGALERGLLEEVDIDKAVRQNFRVMIRLGLWDPPDEVPFAQIGYEAQYPWNRAEHQDAVRRVTQKSIVLLKNEGETLPLHGARLKKVAVIGPLADRVLADWYSGTMPYSVSVVDALRERLGSHRVMLCNSNDSSHAVYLAKQANVAIVCVGSHPTGDHSWAKVTKESYGKEAVDRKSLKLEDEDLVKRVFDANPNTLMVLVSSFPYAIDWSHEHLPAILHITHNSQELGRAVADVLFGDYNPGGRTVQTWPKAIEDLPSMMNYDLTCGRTYLYSEKEPLFPFGFGKSYTQFAYSRLLVSSDVLSEDSPLTLSATIANIGRHDGDEVVQLYVRFLDSAVKRPKKQLIGFQRIHIPSNSSRVVSFSVEAENVRYYDERMRRWVLESSPLELQVGRSSAQIELVTQVIVRGTLPLHGANSTDPVASPPSSETTQHS